MKPTEEILNELAKQLAAIRQLPAGTYPQDFPRPSLNGVVGTMKTTIIEKMGQPDSRTYHERRNRIAYFFFVPQRGVRGGVGIALEIEFDDDDRVCMLKWQLQR